MIVWLRRKGYVSESLRVHPRQAELPYFVADHVTSPNQA